MPRPSGVSVDPSAIHTAVVEVYEALRLVVFSAVPTVQHPTGDAGPGEARRRLNRLAAALRPFPARRLTADPFVRADGPLALRLPGPPSAPPVIGTSSHDLVVRLAGRVYDRLGVVEMRRYTDPKTGQEFDGVIYDGGVKLGDVACPGSPRAQHYSDLDWSADLWRRLHGSHQLALLGLFHSGVCDPGRLSVWLDQEAAALAARDQAGGRSAAPCAAGGRVKGKNIDARMLKVMAENPESHGWSLRKWAAHLGCAPSTVEGTTTWRERLEAVRAMRAAEAARRMDRSRTTPAGRRLKKPR